MNKILVVIMMLSIGTLYGQTHYRKTRSDKGKTHSHSVNYQVKKALKPKTTKTTKKK